MAKHPKPAERGFALLLVLWSLVALTSITAMLLSRGREDVKLASNLRLAAFAETLADSGVHEALFRLLDLAEYRAAGRNYGPPGTPFRTTEELGLVLGMTPDLLARLSPHVSVLQDNEPDPAIADPIVLSALQKAGLAGDVRRAPSAGRVVAITAVANTPGGGRFARRATVRLGASPTGKLFQILDWRRVAG